MNYIDLLDERYSDVNIAREVIRVIKGGDATEALLGTWMNGKSCTIQILIPTNLQGLNDMGIPISLKNLEELQYIGAG